MGKNLHTLYGVYLLLPCRSYRIWEKRVLESHVIILKPYSRGLKIQQRIYQ